MDLPEPSLSIQQRRERWLLATCVLFTLVAAAAPALHGGGLHSHGFADARPWLGLPCALDVLSNLPFLLFGAWGLWRLRMRAAAVDASTRACAALFFGGLVLTAAGSAFYHWQPDDAGLLWDRAAMAVAFAGMLGLAAGGRISPRSGPWLAAAALVGGALAVVAWRASGNLLPWGVVQFGGMALVLVLACLKPAAFGPKHPPLALGWVIAIYALAKAFELADHAIFEATGALVSGHTLKHLVASLAAWPVLAMLAHAGAAARVRHNARGIPGGRPREAAAAQ